MSWGGSRTGREHTELFYLAAHAGSLLEPRTLEETVDLAGTPALTDNDAPVGLLVFEVVLEPEVEP